MMLVEESTVPEASLPLDAFKAHLRMGTGFAEDQVQDQVLAAFLRAAMAAIEARTAKVLIERDFSWSLGRWRDASAQVLPVAPISAIVEVVMTDVGGTDMVVDPAGYRLRVDSQRPALCPVSTVLPTVPQGGQVRIRFIAGYGPEWSDLPPDLAQAVLLLAAHYYEYRSETALGAGCMPFGVTSLIERYRTLRIFAGNVAGSGGAA